MPKRNTRLLILFVAGVVGTAGAESSTSDQRVPPEAPIRQFDDVFERVATVTLFETDSVINVTPVVRLDPEGGLLVADDSEMKIRRYSETGELVWQFGREGPGPLEFSGPTVAVRLNSDSILAMDGIRKGVVWSESSRELRSQIANDFPKVVDADPLGDSVLVSTHPVPDGQGRSEPALHIVDLEDGEVVRSFFSPPVNRYTSRVLQMAGWTQSDIRSQVVATVFAFVDTVYIHDLAGVLTRKIPLPTSHFTRWDDVPEKGASVMGWLFRHTFASEVHWLSDDRLLVQFEEFENNVPKWRLISLRLDGTGDWQILNSPRLHAVDPTSGRFYFEDPNELEPSHLFVAELAG